MVYYHVVISIEQCKWTMVYPINSFYLVLHTRWTVSTCIYTTFSARLTSEHRILVNLAIKQNIMLLLDPKPTHTNWVFKTVWVTTTVMKHSSIMFLQRTSDECLCNLVQLNLDCAKQNIHEYKPSPGDGRYQLDCLQGNQRVMRVEPLLKYE